MASSCRHSRIMTSAPPMMATIAAALSPCMARLLRRAGVSNIILGSRDLNLGGSYGSHVAAAWTEHGDRMGAV